MSDVVIARLRTWWPLLLGHVAAWLVVLLATRLGVHVDPVFAGEMLGLVLSAGVWELGRWLEGRPSPNVQRVGHWLLALGAAVGPPSYQPASSSAQNGSKPVD